MSKIEKHLLVIDDALDREIKERQLSVAPADLLKMANPPVVIDHVQNSQAALAKLAQRAEAGISYDAIICDFKLQPTDEKGEWGTDVLRAVADTIATQAQPVKPKLFLCSKSGCTDSDLQALSPIGAEYFSAYELHYLAAHAAGDEGSKEALSQKARTSNFREFCNQQFGTDFPLDVYRSSNIQEAELGRLDAQTVVDRMNAGTDTQDEAFNLLAPDAVTKLAYQRVTDASGHESVQVGRGIHGDAVSGRLALNEDDVEKLSQQFPSEPIILVLNRDYTTADNALLSKIKGLVMLGRGTQHVSVLAQNHRIPVLFANHDTENRLTVDGDQLLAQHKDSTPSPFAKSGDKITLDGPELALYQGEPPLAEPDAISCATLDKLAVAAFEQTRTVWHVPHQKDATGLRVWCNANNAQDVAAAKSMQAGGKRLVQGIGLLRSEYMDPSTDALRNVQAIAFALQSMDHDNSVRVAEEKKRFYESQKKAFADVYKAAGKDFPVRIRLFDFKPDEFFPITTHISKQGFITYEYHDQTLKELAERNHTTLDQIKKTVPTGVETSASMHLFDNPEVGRNFKSIYYEQCRAIFDAAKEAGVTPQILVPNMNNYYLFNKGVLPVIQQAADDCGFKREQYKLGIMLEDPLVFCNSAEEVPYSGPFEAIRYLRDIGQHCDFISIGSNDLTANALRIKRDDMDAILKWNNVTRNPANPFNTLVDNDRIKIKIAATIQSLRELHPKLEVSLCGRHATDRDSIDFLQTARCHHISVPSTLQAVYQATIESGRAASRSYTSGRNAINAALKLQADQFTAENQAGQSEMEPLPPTNVIPVDPLGWQAAFDACPPPTKGMAFVIIEDDDAQRMPLQNMFGKTRTVRTAATVGEGIETVQALQAEGYKVHLFTDRIVKHDNSIPWNPDQPHPVQQYQGTIGGRLSQMIAAGRLPGMGADDVTVVTGEPEPEDIPSVVSVLTKGRGNLYKQMAQIMDQAATEAFQPIIDKPTGKVKPVSVVIAEDDGWQRGMLEDALEHKKNVHFASTITEAVKKTEELQALGHHVLLMLDNRIPLGDSLPENHPVEREFTRRLDDPYFQLGIGLANWIAEGNMSGITAKDIAVLSAGDFEDLATDIKTISKNRSNYYRDLAGIIDSACANGSFAEREVINTPSEDQKRQVVILLDDDEQVHALAQRQFSALFPNAELKLAKTPEEARQLAEQTENGPALFLFDEQLAAGYGKGSEAIAQMWPSFPDSHFAVVTSSNDLIAAGAVNSDNDCLAPVYSKNELATLAAPRNNLFAFIKSSLDYAGHPSICGYRRVRW